MLVSTRFPQSAPYVQSLQVVAHNMEVNCVQMGMTAFAEAVPQVGWGALQLCVQCSMCVCVWVGGGVFEVRYGCGEVW